MAFVSWLILGPIAASGSSTFRPLFEHERIGQHPPPHRDEDIGIIQRKNELVEQAWINANSVASRNFLLASPPATTPTTAADSTGIGSFSSSMVLTPTMIHLKNDHKEDEENHFVNITTSQLQRKLTSSCLTTPELCPCHETETCCMLENANIYEGPNNLQCTTNSLKIQDVTISSVSGNAYQCNCNGIGGVSPCNDLHQLDCQGKKIGTYFGVCTTGETSVTVSFVANIQILNAEYDVALYINTEGGNASTGTGCVIKGLQQTAPTPSPLVGNAQGSPTTNVCFDLLDAGNLINYPFPDLTLKCADSDDDEYLDFSVGVSFSNNVSE